MREQHKIHSSQLGLAEIVGNGHIHWGNMKCFND